MKKQELLATLEKYGITPTKARGQNFLIDENLLNAMVSDMDLQSGEKVLEVGPGAGVLTNKMIQAGCNVHAVELDNKLHQFLSETHNEENFTLVHNDACKVNFEEYLNLPDDFRCLANLPYAISSIFVAKMLELSTPPLEMYFLVQKEMADRVCAPANCKDYGCLTVRSQALYACKILRKVPPSVFHPPPKVDSAFLKMALKPVRPSRRVFKFLSTFTKIAFSQRRKKAMKLLSAKYDKALLTEAFEACGVSIDTRAENITVEQYIALSEYLIDKI